MERVIFRTECDEYVSGPKYLAIFPDDKAHPGQLACVPFFFDGHGMAHFEPYCEIGLAYYYQQTSIVHKTSDESQTLLQAIERYYDGKFKIVEKITH